MMILTSKMAKNISGISFILTAAKNYNSNFADSPFWRNYCSYANGGHQIENSDSNLIAAMNLSFIVLKYLHFLR